MIEITAEVLDSLHYEPYRKVGLVRVRQLMEEDYRQRQGIIQTLEGPSTFHPGDYLARGVLDEEWVMGSGSQMEGYVLLDGKDDEGFVTYRPVSILCYACRIQEPFLVKRANGLVLSGKAGDYLLHLGDKGRIVDRVVFEQSYQRING
ncbi:hypothetical protein KDW_39410 [Dictyobacter vulcani]|uniref:Uncharacterized protein n=1 Tax=Dictyobacter vulcani TaxID=2607529 RepID=A0A5J4KUM5_9CHLR|nr:PGDYG domain-containing protein [Dictyobacter vulcani]GER89779.1 hypothetical protein KDW_39410 [Dictyobacter vulcani]